jgi:hypothetical protein
VCNGARKKEKRGKEVVGRMADTPTRKNRPPDPLRVRIASVALLPTLAHNVSVLIGCWRGFGSQGRRQPRRRRFPMRTIAGQPQPLSSFFPAQIMRFLLLLACAAATTAELIRFGYDSPVTIEI